MKKLFFLLPFALLFAPPAFASVLSYGERIELCSTFKEANDRGWSGKTMLLEVLRGQGQPSYMADIIHKEIRSVCPRVY